MVSDGNAATTQAEHEASLTAFYLTFGDVMDTDMVVGLLTRSIDRGGMTPMSAAADSGRRSRLAIGRMMR